MKEDSLSTKEMISDIGSMRTKAIVLQSHGKIYSDLLGLLLSKDYYYEDDTPYPTLKELTRESGLTYEKVRKYLRQIYEDLVLNYETRPVFSFSKTRYYFILSDNWKGKSLTFEADQIPVMPRVGEEISIPFFNAFLGERHFYVDKISHEFTEDGQAVNIWLKAGFYNLYWEYRKDQAKAENELPFEDWYKLNEFELKRKLGVGRM